MVKLYGDKDFRYRVQGTAAWTTLAGGVAHTLNLQPSQRIELSSIFKLSEFTISGNVKNINLDNTSLTTLANFATDTPLLEDVYVRSSTDIVDMYGAFKGSGVLTIDIDSRAVTSMSECFKNAYRITNAILNTTNLVNTSKMFYGSNISKFTSLSFPFTTSLGVCVEAYNLKDVGDTLNLENVKGSDLDSNTFNSHTLTNAYSLITVNGKIFPKVYTRVPDIATNMSAEIEVVGSVFDTSYSSVDATLQSFTTSTDILEDIEIDIKNENAFTTNTAKLEQSLLSTTNQTVSPTLTTELDIVSGTSSNYKKEDIVLHNKYQFDTTLINANFDLVIDASLQ